MSRRDLETEALSLPDSFRSALASYRADYDIGGTTRYLPTPKGVRLDGSGADYHYRDEVKYLRGIERARFYDRNNMVAGQGVNRLVANVVQDGFNLDVDTGDAALDEDLEDGFWDWADDADACDVEGEKTFCEMETLALRSLVVDGDVFCLLLADGHLQWIEAHRVRTPRGTKKNVVHGILLEETTARRQQYWVTKQDLDPLASLKLVGDTTPIDARDEAGHKQVLHQYLPGRFSQRRGMTAFAPIVFPLNYHDDLQFAKLVQAQMTSCWAILDEATEFAKPETGSSAATGTVTEDTHSDGTSRIQQGVSPGMRVRVPQGRKYTGFSPNVPNTTFFDHAHLILTIIAVNLDLPVHVLLLDPSKTNFSGWRGAIDQARIRYRQIQAQRIKQFHTPVYRWYVRRRLAQDPALAKRIEANNVDIFGHTWRPNTWSYIEPVKDVTADLLETRSSLTSQRRRCARRGDQWSEIVPEIADDNGCFIEAMHVKATELNKKHKETGLAITWRDVAALPMPEGISVSVSPEKEDEPAEKPADKEAAA